MGRPKKRLNLKTEALIEAARIILMEHHPMTVRQVYYQLVSAHVIENKKSQYVKVSRALAAARRRGIVPWEWIEDRLRQPRQVSMWDDVPDFADTCVQAYRRNVWASQPEYIETWLEKDALSGIFEEVLEPFGITLNVGRGYDGWDSIHNAAGRLNDDSVILYWGDFDPSGEDMLRSLGERLAELGCKPEITKCALVSDDIARYSLPPDFAKRSDNRTAKFIAEHGDVSVELDALPVDVLRERLIQEIESRMDLEALAEVKEQEDADRETIREAMKP